VRHGLPPVTQFPEASLNVTRSGQISVDYPEAKPLLHFIAEYAAQARSSHHETLAQLYKIGAPDIASWAVAPYKGGASPHTLAWEAIGTYTAGPIHIDRYLLHHSTYLQMPMLHIHDDRTPLTRGALLWFSLQGHANEKDWPQIIALLNQGYEVYSFDFRGLGETRMNYRAVSEDDPGLVKGDLEQAYMSPLSSVLGGYVYNSLLTGRPYFMQLLDDLQIAARFIRSRHSNAPLPITLAGVGEASGLAASFQQINPSYESLPGTEPQAPDWFRLVVESRENWPIAFLLPSGAMIH